MDVTVSAEAHLKVIRSLMEKATIYRAISSATAAVGGLISVIAAFYLANRSIPEPTEFLVIWSAVCLITLASNTYFISLGAEKRKEPIFSRGMRAMLTGALPCLVSAILITMVLFKTIGAVWCCALWMLFYGLMLISTFHFAPRSVLWLGIAFLLSSWIVLLLLYWHRIDIDFPTWVASKMMGATFGLFHLIYAAATWPRKGGFMASLEPNR